MTSEERKIQELPETSSISLSDQFIVENEDGTKLSDLATLKKLMNANFIVENLEAMKSASFKEGEVCITLGYRTAGDGGGAMYKIVYEPALVEDGANVIYLLTSDVNRAKFISQNNCVTPEQFGAVGDGTRDDSEAFKKCIASNYKIVCRKNASYYVGALPLANNLFLDLNGASLISNGRSIFKSTDADKSYQNIVICNGYLRGKDDSAAGLVAEISSHTNNVVFENLVCKNLATSNSFLIGNHEGMIIRNCSFVCGAASGYDAVKVNYTIADKSFRDKLSIVGCDFKNFINPIQVRGKLTSYSGTILNDSTLDLINIEGCIGKKDATATGSFVTVYGACTINISNCRSSQFGTFATVNGGAIRSNVNISNVTADKVDTFLVTSTGADQVNSKYTVAGNIIVSAGASSALKSLFNIVAGTLYLNTSAFQMDSAFKESLVTGGTLSQSADVMKVVDCSSADSKDILPYTGTTDSVDISSFGKISNLFIDLKSASGNVTAITGGVVGQIVKMVSSGNRTIYNNSTSLCLSESTVALSAYKSITLKKINSSTWAQI